MSETILIKGHFCELYYVKCGSTIESHIKKGLDPDIAERTVAKKNGCNSISESPLHDIDDILFHTCVCNFKHPLMGHFMQVTEAYENGLLPFGGSYSEQPAKIIEIIQLILSMKVDYNIYMHKKQIKKG